MMISTDVVSHRLNSYEIFKKIVLISNYVLKIYVVVHQKTF